MTSALKRLMHSVGLELTRHPGPNSLPWQLRQLFERREIRSVLDVGAHEGGFVRMLRDVAGYEGRVSSFEPSAASFEQLCRDRATDRAWCGHRVALGAAAGRLELNTFVGSDFNSFLLPNDVGRSRFGALSEGHTEAVEVRRLDSFDVVEGSLLKIDTQGFDLEVLEGASGILPAVAAIMLELPVRPIYEGAPDFVEIVSRLAGWGYEPVGFFPLSRDADRLRVIEFDGVFLRNDGT